MASAVTTSNTHASQSQSSTNGSPNQPTHTRKRRLSSPPQSTNTSSSSAISHDRRISNNDPNERNQCQRTVKTENNNDANNHTETKENKRVASTNTTIAIAKNESESNEIKDEALPTDSK
jgi:hypothetical protein